VDLILNGRQIEVLSYDDTPKSGKVAIVRAYKYPMPIREYAFLEDILLP